MIRPVSPSTASGAHVPLATQPEFAEAEVICLSPPFYQLRAPSDGDISPLTPPAAANRLANRELAAAYTLRLLGITPSRSSDPAIQSSLESALVPCISPTEHFSLPHVSPPSRGDGAGQLPWLSPSDAPLGGCLVVDFGTNQSPIHQHDLHLLSPPVCWAATRSSIFQLNVWLEHLDQQLFIKEVLRRRNLLDPTQ